MARPLVLIVILTGVFCLSGFVSCGSQKPEQPGIVYEELSPGGFLAAMRNLSAADYTLIDVRTPAEFAGGFIEGAVNINYNDPGFRDQMAALDRLRRYFVYCRSGARTRGAAEVMKSLGFMNVKILSGGMNSWLAESLPVKK